MSLIYLFDKDSLRSRIAVWFIALLWIMWLSYVQIATRSQFTFPTASIFSVIAVAWIGGWLDILVIAIVAAASREISDYMAQPKDEWNHVLNFITRSIVYSVVGLITYKIGLAYRYFRKNYDKDPLTGLLNRRAFNDLGIAEVERAKRYRHTMAVVFIDLDNFKQLNDSRGHKSGDRCLRAVANALMSNKRQEDQIARLGGDEFAIICPETGLSGATVIGNRMSYFLQEALASYPPVSASIGIAVFEPGIERFENMLNIADALMYEVKKSGKPGMMAKHYA